MAPENAKARFEKLILFEIFKEHLSKYQQQASITIWKEWFYYSSTRAEWHHTTQKQNMPTHLRRHLLWLFIQSDPLAHFQTTQQVISKAHPMFPEQNSFVVLSTHSSLVFTQMRIHESAGVQRNLPLKAKMCPWSKASGSEWRNLFGLLFFFLGNVSIWWLHGSTLMRAGTSVGFSSVISHGGFGRVYAAGRHTSHRNFVFT